MSEHSNERRQSQRITVDLKIRGRTGAEETFSRTANLSMGGIFVNELLPFEEGTSLELDFILPGDGTLIHAEATVVHASDSMDINPEQLPGNGLRFDALDPVSRDALAVYLDEEPG